LAKPVVEIAADTVFFGVTDAQEFAFDQLTLRDITAKEEGAFSGLVIEKREDIGEPFAVGVAGGKDGIHRAAAQRFGDDRF